MLFKRLGLIIVAFAAVLGLITACQASDPEAPTEIPAQIPNSNGDKTVSLVAEPATAPADGISAIRLIAACTVDGKQAPNGLPVEFRTDNGQFSANGVEPITTGGDNLLATVTTTAGSAQIFLLSPTNIGSANIRATFVSEVADNETVSFTPPNNRVSAIELVVSPTSGQAPLTATATITVSDSDGNGLEGITVLISSDNGAVVLSKTRDTTATDGTIVITINNINSDTVITADAQGHKATQTITITNDTEKSIELEAVNFGTDPVVVNNQGQLLLRATVTGDSGTVASKRVTFTSTDNGTQFNPVAKSTDTNGEAESFASNITQNSTISATAGSVRDSINVVINSAPVAIINLLAGTITTGQVNQLTFSAESSYDPDEPYGDTIDTFTWAYTVESTNNLPVTTSTSSNGKLQTVVIGEAAGILPVSGDKVTIMLTVIDENNLQTTETYEIVFS